MKKLTEARFFFEGFSIAVIDYNVPVKKRMKAPSDYIILIEKDLGSFMKTLVEFKKTGEMTAEHAKKAKQYIRDFKDEVLNSVEVGGSADANENQIEKAYGVISFLYLLEEYNYIKNDNLNGVYYTYTECK